MIRSARRLVKKGASIVIGRTEEFYSLQRIWKKDHKTDTFCRIQNTELYDDRDDIHRNLMGAYYRLLTFTPKNLPDRTYLKGMQRISLRDMIFRDVVANLLVHREFSNAFPAILTIYKGPVVTGNRNLGFVLS